MAVALVGSGTSGGLLSVQPMYEYVAMMRTTCLLQANQAGCYMDLKSATLAILRDRMQAKNFL